ncbi:MAG: GGDEF domain-containing protein [Planctomycetota bacterium]|nr:MAG: GGDEF domain-containing protein [Planctomycetota bacterium]
MIEFLYTLAGLIAGIVIFASLYPPSASTEAPVQAPEADPEILQAKVEVQQVSDNLQDITSHVASSVGEHSAEIEQFNAALIDSATQLPEHLSKAIVQVLAANRKMQAELADAQKQIEEQSKLIEKTSRQARTDALTGLANRRALEEYLRDELGKSNSNRLSGLLLMDIDHFKKFNDTFGHTVGDLVLSNFGKWLNEICDENCHTFRYGGEEFAVVIEADTPEEMVAQAAAIRKFVSEQVLPHDGMQLRVTASGGLCTLIPGETIESAYERADEGLYKSKEAGRNRGHWLDDDQWRPFPDAPLPESAAETAEAPASSASTDSVSDAAVKEESDHTDRRDVEPSDEQEQPEILTLNFFMSRLDGSLDQLQRADLPAGGMMIQAIAEDGENEPLSQEAWKQLEALIRSNVRGIDVICHFRQNAICVFMPGCSMRAITDRAAHILAAHAELRAGAEAGELPRRLAISVAMAGELEKGAEFLDRLEQALDAALAADPNQIAVHEGHSVVYRDV